MNMKYAAEKHGSAAYFLGQFWVTYSEMTQNDKWQKVTKTTAKPHKTRH